MNFGKNFSAAKFAANKKNARKSTGPKATQGKTSAKKNGLNHGFFRRESRNTT
jgi:hypothetical protein